MIAAHRLNESPAAAIERLAERNARLVVRLQRTSEAYHRASGHAAARWIDCSDAVCLMNLRVIQRNEAPDARSDAPG